VSPYLAGDDPGAVTVDREQYRAQHGPVVRMEPAAKSRDELVGSSLRILLTPGRYLGTRPFQVFPSIFAESHQAAPFLVCSDNNRPLSGSQPYS
jgi:hypothetical protein